MGVASSEQRQAAQNSVMDLTRTIQRKKEKELAALQFVGGEASGAEAARARAGEGRPQRSLPLRKRKEVQKMLRSVR